MNQILITQNNKISYLKYDYFTDSKTIIKKHKKNYLIIFLVSFIICILTLFYLLFSFILRINSVSKSSILLEKYNIFSACSYSNSYESIKLSNNIYIIGLIEIPGINISYPILSDCNSELLKISVCKFSGPMPNELGNMCIAGHNYKNNLMFSKLDKLNINDYIFITDLNDNKVEYIIYQKLEINQDDFKYVQNTNSTEVTLITCNSNNNTKRIVIKAKKKG